MVCQYELFLHLNLLVQFLPFFSIGPGSSGTCFLYLLGSCPQEIFGSYKRSFLYLLGSCPKRYLVVTKGAGLLQTKEVIEFNICVKYFTDIEGTVSNLEAGK